MSDDGNGNGPRISPELVAKAREKLKESNLTWEELIQATFRWYLEQPEKEINQKD